MILQYILFEKTSRTGLMASSGSRVNQIAAEAATCVLRDVRIAALLSKFRSIESMHLSLPVRGVCKPLDGAVKCICVAASPRPCICSNNAPESA